MRRNNAQYEFLPAAEEIVETPASPFGRIVLWLIIALVVIALVWSYVGQIDVIATAAGRIVPDGNVKTIQASVGGMINTIDVREGQKVTKGQTLITLDPTLARKTVDAASQALAVARLERAVIMAINTGTSAADLIANAEVSQQIKDDFMQLAYSRKSVAAVRRSALSIGISQAQSQLAAERQNQQTLADTLDATRAARAHIAEQLAAADSVDQIRLQAQLNDIDSRITTQQAALGAQQQRTAQAESSVLQASANLQNFNADTSSADTTSTIDADKRIVELSKSLDEAKQTLAWHTLIAPVDGTVLTVTPTTIGGVATLAQPLVTIVPSDATLYVEASVSPSDVGFVHEGQPVAVKVDSFSFQRYGLLHGTVEKISADAINDEKKGPIYKARIKLYDTKTSQGTTLALTPGMLVTGEITTGQRRLIEFFLDPLMTHIDTSLKVR